MDATMDATTNITTVLPIELQTVILDFTDIYSRTCTAVCKLWRNALVCKTHAPNSSVAVDCIANNYINLLEIVGIGKISRDKVSNLCDAIVKVRCKTNLKTDPEVVQYFVRATTGDDPRAYESRSYIPHHHVYSFLRKTALWHNEITLSVYINGLYAGFQLTVFGVLCAAIAVKKYEMIVILGLYFLTGDYIKELNEVSKDLLEALAPEPNKKKLA